MTAQKLIRDLKRGDLVAVRLPASTARVTTIGPAPAGSPEGALFVNFRFLDGARRGDLDGVIVPPMQRVQLP